MVVDITAERLARVFAYLTAVSLGALCLSLMETHGIGIPDRWWLHFLSAAHGGLVWHLVSGGAVLPKHTS